LEIFTPHLARGLISCGWQSCLLPCMLGLPHAAARGPAGLGHVLATLVVQVCPAGGRCSSHRDRGAAPRSRGGLKIGRGLRADHSSRVRRGRCRAATLRRSCPLPSGRARPTGSVSWPRPWQWSLGRLRDAE
ncbi:unnamed protein product, partial [Prorocentrum cordatum]